MGSNFDSFDASALGAFIESPLGARGVAAANVQGDLFVATTGGTFNGINAQVVRYEKDTDTWSAANSGLGGSQDNVIGFIIVRGVLFCSTGLGEVFEWNADVEIWGAMDLAAIASSPCYLKEYQGDLAAFGKNLSDGVITTNAAVYDHDAGTWSSIGSDPFDEIDDVRINGSTIIAVGVGDHPLPRTPALTGVVLATYSGGSWTVVDGTPLGTPGNRVLISDAGATLVTVGTGVNVANDPDFPTTDHFKQVYDTIAVEEVYLSTTEIDGNDDEIVASFSEYNGEGTPALNQPFDPVTDMTATNPSLYPAAIAGIKNMPIGLMIFGSFETYNDNSVGGLCRVNGDNVTALDDDKPNDVNCIEQYGSSYLIGMSGADWVDGTPAGLSGIRGFYEYAGTGFQQFGSSVGTNTGSVQAIINTQDQINLAPSVSIVSPANNSVVEFGVDATFIATATDPEEGNLSESITWSSNVDGALGTGASITLSSLSEGSHTITATIADEYGKTATDTILIDVKVVHIESVTPSSGTTAGGTTVTIAGFGFTGSTSVTFDGNAGTSLNFISATEIEIDTPSGTAGSVDVVATVGSDSDTLTNGFTYAAGGTGDPPVVTITSPSSGGSYTTSDVINFTGTATDTEDGTISSSIIWVSNDGVNPPNFLGVGASINSTLPAGTTSVLASVTDSDGNRDTDSITVTVT